MSYHYPPTPKTENEFGEKVDEDFDLGIVKTIEWYLNKYNKKGKNA